MKGGGGRQARDSNDPPRSRAVRRQRGRREHRRAGKGRRPRIHRARRARYDRAKHSCASTQRETGASFSTRCASTRRRPRTWSMRMSPEISASSTPASCRCESPATVSLPVDGASGAFDWTGMIPFDQLPQLYNPAIGFAFNANNADVSDDHQPSFGFGLRGEFPRPPHPAVLRYDHQSTASKPRPPCRPTTCLWT